MTACPSDADLARLVAGSLGEAARASIEAHVAGCDRCAAVLADRGARRRVGRYELDRRIAAGGMGEVWAAWDPQLRREIAIKLVRPERGGDGRERLLREARALARLTHPHVLAVFDVGEEDGEIFLATELVVGETLASRGGPSASWRELVRLYAQAARGLAAAHAAGLVHRDVKPANLLLGADGRVRVADFGLATRPAVPEASLTASGFVVGTPAYMAPEQRAGRPADARADQYALCVSLVEAIDGRRPPAAPDAAGLASFVAERRPREPALDALCAILARGLASDPSRRFADVSQLAVALEQLVAPDLASAPTLASSDAARQLGAAAPPGAAEPSSASAASIRGSGAEAPPTASRDAAAPAGLRHAGLPEAPTVAWRDAAGPDAPPSASRDTGVPAGLRHAGLPEARPGSSTLRGAAGRLRPGDAGDRHTSSGAAVTPGDAGDRHTSSGAAVTPGHAAHHHTPGDAAHTPGGAAGRLTPGHAAHHHAPGDPADTPGGAGGHVTPGYAAHRHAPGDAAHTPGGAASRLTPGADRGGSGREARATSARTGEPRAARRGTSVAIALVAAVAGVGAVLLAARVVAKRPVEVVAVSPSPVAPIGPGSAADPAPGSAADPAPGSAADPAPGSAAPVPADPPAREPSRSRPGGVPLDPPRAPAAPTYVDLSTFVSDVQKHLRGRDTRACRALIAGLPPNVHPSARGTIDLFGSLCDMVAGDCAGGAARLERALASQGGVQLAMYTDQYCPIEGDLETRLVRLRTQTTAHAQPGAASQPWCEALIPPARRAAGEASTPQQRAIAAYALQQLAKCVGSVGRCDDARSLWALSLTADATGRHRAPELGERCAAEAAALAATDAYADTTQLEQGLSAAIRQRDLPACRRLIASFPASVAPGARRALETLQAHCEMLSGDCAGGMARLTRLGPTPNPTDPAAVKMWVSSQADTYCPIAGDLSARVARIWSQVDAFTARSTRGFSGNVAWCDALLVPARAAAAEASAASAAERRRLALSLQRLAGCVASASRCDDARDLWSLAGQLDPSTPSSGPTCP